MTGQTAAEIAVLALALGAAWLSIRKPSPLDWERLWKSVLATIIRGEVERAGGDQAVWWSRLRGVPFHPVGRDAGAKLNRADPADVGIPALEGERALVERLGRLDTVEARWQAMFRDDPAAQQAMLSDPADLGPAYDPSGVLAPGVGWSDVANWNADVQAAIARRLEGVVVAAAGSWAPALSRSLPHGDVVSLDSETEAVLLGGLRDPHQRLVLVTEGPRIHAMLVALHASPALRDRVVMVLALDPQFDDAWMAEHFQHEPFDTELNRQTPYVAVSNARAGCEPVLHNRFPQPAELASGWRPIAPIDLGLLDLDELEPELVARALWVFTAFCLSRH